MLLDALLAKRLLVLSGKGGVGKSVVGLALALAARERGSLDSLQEAFLELGAAQCGICTPGMLMAARAYLDAGGGADHGSIREGIAGNLCRCTGYQKIVEAIAAVAAGEPA